MTGSRTRAEEVRLRYLYRRLVVTGALQLPPDAAAALVGPDCAYQLYRRWSLPVKPGPPGSSPGVAATPPRGPQGG